MTQEKIKKFIKKNREDMDFNYNYRGGHFIEPEITLSDALDELEKAVVVIEAGKDIIAQMELRELHDKGFDDLYKKADSVYKEALKKWEGEDSKISEKGKMELANAGYAEAKKDRETKARHWQECKNKPVGG